ncbi:hypothetical protein C471_07606 [Halorubrum saccharovorum DSM 1137]|uniref:Uncharacterized protein n=1 Tax=Halorubrum saccharovorum DSM 1137 TaxID=1227484 RepID=M0DYS0_9EURY|nr:hypothetical protein [Halorubrum saccharovorum]ELZ40631.1 hypothetical protein C471_07606 [Halorubrum saccharovorum DSM 1137]
MKDTDETLADAADALTADNNHTIASSGDLKVAVQKYETEFTATSDLGHVTLYDSGDIVDYDGYLLIEHRIDDDDVLLDWGAQVTVLSVYDDSSEQTRAVASEILTGDEYHSNASILSTFRTEDFTIECDSPLTGLLPDQRDAVQSPSWDINFTFALTE